MFVLGIVAADGESFPERKMVLELALVLLLLLEHHCHSMVVVFILKPFLHCATNTAKINNGAAQATVVTKDDSNIGDFAAPWMLLMFPHHHILVLDARTVILLCLGQNCLQF